MFPYAADVDYVSLSETVTFVSSGGSDTLCRDVTIIDDSMEEDDESFQVQIDNSDCLLSRTVADVTIIDDGTEYT